MVKLTAELIVDAQRERVWEVLTDFPSYPEWHPYQTISGKADHYSVVKIQTRALGSDTVIDTARAVISHHEPHQRLEFSTGNPLFWSTRRFFVLSSNARGTFLTHGIRMAGFLAKRAFERRDSSEPLRAYLHAFGVALARRAVSAPSGPAKPGNRHARRAARTKGS